MKQVPDTARSKELVMMLETLQKYFGYKTFYPLQEDIIMEVFRQNDAFVLMPTGGGKSMLSTPGPTL